MACRLVDGTWIHAALLSITPEESSREIKINIEKKIHSW